MTADRIGIVGLGRMGRGLARRLASQSIPVTGWTRSGLTAEAATALGLTAAADLRALTAASDVIFLSLFDDTAVAEVMDTLLTLDIRGKLIIDTSTVSPAPFAERAEAIAAAGVAVVDAPISGGPEMVEAGTCGFFIGGRPEDCARADAAIALVTDRRFIVGPLGSGMVMKTINNTMLQGYFTTLRQLLPLAKRGGLPLEEMLEILATGPAGMPFLRDRMPRILGQDDSVGFSIRGAAKDTDVFLAVAAAHGVPVPILDGSREGMLRAIDAGLGEEDPAAILAAVYRDA